MLERGTIYNHRKLVQHWLWISHAKSYFKNWRNVYTVIKLEDSGFKSQLIVCVTLGKLFHLPRFQFLPVESGDKNKYIRRISVEKDNAFKMFSTRLGT